MAETQADIVCFGRKSHIIHYLGKQAYADLPAYLKAFDVAMLPFALNDATQFISPTKTLEYMATHKPIVSTPIKDVSTLYSSVVRIAGTAEAFVTQIEAALAESRTEIDARYGRERELLQRYEWEQIASEMKTTTREQRQIVVWWQGGGKRHLTRDSKKTLCHLWIPSTAYFADRQQPVADCQRCQRQIQGESL